MRASNWDASDESESGEARPGGEDGRDGSEVEVRRTRLVSVRYDEGAFERVEEGEKEELEQSEGVGGVGLESDLENAEGEG